MKMFAKDVMVTMKVMMKMHRRHGLGATKRDVGGGTITGVGVNWTYLILNSNGHAQPVKAKTLHYADMTLDSCNSLFLHYHLYSLIFLYFCLYSYLLNRSLDHFLFTPTCLT